MTHMTHMTHCYNPTRMRARAHARAGSTVSMCHMRHDPPGMGRGVPPDRWAPPCGTIVIQEDRGYACTQCRYFASLGVCIVATPRHGAEGPTSTKAPRCGSGKTETRAPAHEVAYSWVDLVGTPASANGGGYSRGLVARIRPAERQRGAEPPETASTLAGMTHSHTMQETLPSRPTPVSALTPAGERKEMTAIRASHAIVVGFACQP
jgi:hypothetical protein